MAPTVEEIAQVVHEANRVLQKVNHEKFVSSPWDEAPRWQRDSCIDGVQRAILGDTPKELHESWVHYKKRDGWRYGAIKDEWAKTHPCMVPYEELPEYQKQKDLMFIAIVEALSGPQQRDAGDTSVLRMRSSSSEPA